MKQDGKWEPKDGLERLTPKKAANQTQRKQRGDHRRLTWRSGGSVQKKKWKKNGVVIVSLRAFG